MKQPLVRFATVGLGLALLAFLISCSAAKPQFARSEFIGSPPSNLPSIESDDPRLILEVSPQVGYAPSRVTLHAVLRHVSSSDPRYTCLQEEWDFGDGSISGQKLNCQSNFNEDANFEYVVEHMYRSSGSYLVQFRLGDGAIYSNRVNVHVISR